MKKILIVEDDQLSASALADYLEANGYATSVADTGPKGVERFLAEKPDLMMIDVQLPLRNGFEVCFDIRKAPGGADVPVVLMSAVYTNLEHAEPYAKQGLGAQEYLVKPFSMKEMLKRVQALLD